MNEVKNSIFREELPGEKKSIVNLLIDRGDLSKEVEIEKIPYIQRKIKKNSKNFKKK